MTRRARVAARAGATLAVVAASTLMWAAPAHAAAATINVSEAQLSYTAAAGQDNHLIIGNVTGSPDTYVFFEAGGIPITSTDSACWHSDPNYSNIMACTLPGLAKIVVDVRDGGDAVVNFSDAPTLMYGGDGDDYLWLGGRTGTQSRGYGQAGNDHIMSGPGDDIMDGGAGADTAAYLDSLDPVVASLVTNTGTRSYDTDTFYSMENLTGGGGADVLYGNDARNVISGGWGKVCTTRGGYSCTYVDGDDTLYGGGADDKLYPGLGHDTVYGGAGNDQIFGDRGNDYLLGEGGDDLLDGGSGTDNINGGPGYDACSGETLTACES